MSTSGARVSNAWVICPQAWDNQSKDWLIPNETTRTEVLEVKGFSLEDEPMWDQLVGEVMAHQGDDP